MDGILLIDKDSNMSSFDVIRILKKKLNIDKIGHAGTLDPFATGLLVILLGKATKLSDILLNEDKTYHTTFTFGTHTNTYDLTGDVLFQDDTIVTESQINDALSKLKSYDQEPPMFSALKVNGKKLYELARQDIEIERVKRPVSIQSKMIDFNFPHAMLSLHVSKGTYIRSLAVDLAKQLQTYAHVSSLRRIQSGMFSIENAKTIQTISLHDVIPLSTLLVGYDSITVSDYIESKIAHGLQLDHRQYTKDTMFIVKNQKGDILALYKPYGNQLYKPVATFI